MRPPSRPFGAANGDGEVVCVALAREIEQRAAQQRLDAAVRAVPSRRKAPITTCCCRKTLWASGRPGARRSRRMQQTAAQYLWRGPCLCSRYRAGGRRPPSRLWSSGLASAAQHKAEQKRPKRPRRWKADGRLCQGAPGAVEKAYKAQADTTGV